MLCLHIGSFSRKIYELRPPLFLNKVNEVFIRILRYSPGLAIFYERIICDYLLPMVQVSHPYQSQAGHIKLSQAKGVSRFQNTTQGIALKYVLQGQELYLIQGEYVHLSAGQFILLAAGQPYQAVTRQARSITKGICIDLDPDFVTEQVPHLMQEELCFNMSIQGVHFLRLHQSFRGLVQMDLKAEGEAILHQLRRGLDDLTQHIGQLKAPLQAQAKRSNTQKWLLSRLLMVKDHICQHFRETVTLEELALASGISTSHLNRSYRQCFGLTPQQFQLQLRMEEAQILLANPRLSLTEIALRLGYTDLAAFSNQFKKYHHQPPSRFRKSL